MAKILIQGGTILGFSDDSPHWQRGDVLVAGDRIIAIETQIEAEDASRIDGTGCVVMPGLVDAHLHCWQTPLRGIAVNWTLQDYLTKILGEIGPRFSPEDIYWSTLAAALDQIDAGVTTVVDWCHNAPTPAHAEAALAALRDAGIRAVFLRGSFAPDVDTKMTDDCWSDVDMPPNANGLLQLGMSVLGPAYSSLDTVRFELRRAMARDEVISMHFSGPVTSNAFRQLAREGLITPKVNIVHGNGMCADELQALIDCGATFTVTPEIEMQMGFSACITGRLLAAGVRPSLGVDSETASSSEMFQVARFAMQLQRYMDHQTAWQDTAAPMAEVSIGARDVLRWATIEGAHAAGLDGKIGTLAAGKLADIILVRTPDILPGLDPTQFVVSRAASSDVDTVMISGQLRKAAGRRVNAVPTGVAAKLSEISQRVLLPKST
jgi:5-methylthioadenosine/S-adenosylhomocysteine deaminase